MTNLTIPEAHAILKATARTTVAEVTATHAAMAFELHAGPSDRLTLRDLQLADTALAMLVKIQPTEAPAPAPYWYKACSVGFPKHL